MPLIKTFRGRPVKRTQRIGSDRIWILYNDGKSGQQQVISFEDYQREVKKEYVPRTGK